jgi:hypothetical protein
LREKFDETIVFQRDLLDVEISIGTEVEISA